MRADLNTIIDWIKPESRILDLGCGEGTLLTHLRDTKNVSGYGLEIQPGHIQTCIASGLNVIQANLDDGLTNYFADNSFDYVVMTQTLQAMTYPDRLIDEMLRVGSEGIVTFPNMGFWKARGHLMLKGTMPITKSLPHSWYNTPNIHLCTVRDFEALCHKKNINILERAVVDSQQKSSPLMRMFPGLLGEVALYRFNRK